MPQTLESVLLEQANPHVGPFLERIRELLAKYALDVYMCVGPNVGADGRIYWQMSTMPVLPFFIELAALCEVPIEQVHVHAESESEISTYGGEHHLSIDIRVDRVFR